MTAPPPPAVAALVERVRDACGVVLGNEVAAALEALARERDTWKATAEKATGYEIAAVHRLDMAHVRITALEAEARQLALDLQAAQARASGAEARERSLKAARAEMGKGCE